MEFLEIISPWWGIFSTVVTLASAITAATPTPKDDAILAKIVGFIRILGLNVGKAAPKE